MRLRKENNALARSFILIMIPMLFSVNVFGQGPGKTAENRKHSLFKGSKALQFGITSDLRLISFQGIALSGKRQYSEKTAIRIGLDLYLRVSDSDYNSVRVGQSPPGTYKSSISNQEAVSLRVQYMRYYSPKEVIKAYWAVGPLVEFGHYFYEERRSDLSTSYTRRTDIGWGIGASFVLGTEWFASPNIGIHAEYTLTLDYNWEKEKSKSGSESNLTDSTNRTHWVELDATEVRFGLSAYF